MKPISEAFRHSFRSAALGLAMLLMAPLACGPVEPAAEPDSLTTQQQEQESDNGLAANGLSANGLSANGLSANGLSANGLSANGLSASSFSAWFRQNPSHGDLVMRYVVRCAVPEGQSRTYQDPQTQVRYTWHGGLGLAPGWAGGQPATLAEQQLVSACMAAHVNKFGVSVTISVLGLTAANQLIPFTTAELQLYSRKEACFFGNLFNNQGVFFGSEGSRLAPKESSSRACVLSSLDPVSANACPPLTYTDSCADICQPIVPGGFYTTCTWRGVTYKALTTRISPNQIFSCGDKVCQVSEQCSTGPGKGCEKDCGKCGSGTR